MPSTPANSAAETDPAARLLRDGRVGDLADYEARGGGGALRAARATPPLDVLAEIEASGLRGRGGAGFPTGRKWRTVCRYERGEIAPPTVVINGAEGEPGSFKDRTLLRANPYLVLEGALIAAHTLGADTIVIGLRRSFETERERIGRAVDELRAAGWLDTIELDVLAGPEEYLFGEETALLEVLDGRAPLPRIAPPFRRGAEEVVDESVRTTAEQVTDFGTGSTSAAGVELAGPTTETIAPPTLVNNVETIANVPGIVVEGADWFRAVGTEESPGTMLCTITGGVARDGVGEVAMGTPLRQAIEAIGGGPRPGRRIRAVMGGVSNPLIMASELDTPLTYESMQEMGGGLGCGAFIVFDDETDFTAVAAGVARFLAIESCGQCTPCKQDGLELAETFTLMQGLETRTDPLARVRTLLATVTEGARCNLAHQYPAVLQRIVDELGDELVHPGQSDTAPAPVALIAPIVDIEDGRATLEEHHFDKQPDWTFDPAWSGQSPADRLAEHRAPESA